MHLLLLLASPATLAASGPDASGLLLSPSTSTGGPPHALLDLSSGDSLALADGDTATVSLPFSFEWYSSSWDELTLSTDGVVFFDGATAGGSGDCPGTGGTWNGVAALWQDWDAPTVTVQTFGRYPSRAWAVGWTGTAGGSTGEGAVQLWLLEGRDEAVVVLDDLDFGDAAVDGGAAGVAGAQGGSTSGLEWSCAGGLTSGTSAWFGFQQNRPSGASRTTASLDDPWTGTEERQYAGRALAAGDENVDGFGDFLVGSQATDQAFLVRGGAVEQGGSLALAQAVITASSAGNELGAAAVLADLDGDGADDLVLGAPEDDTADASGGAVFVLLGGSLGGAIEVPGDADLAAYGTKTPISGSSVVRAQRAGSALAAADVDGDGYGDLLVGAPGDDSAATNAGAAFLVLGGATASGSLSLSAAEAAFSGAAASDAAGQVVAAADLDADGAAEMLVSAPYSNDGADYDAGRVYLLAGGPWSGAASLASAANATLVGESASDQLGSALAAGDPDGDGAADLFVGVPYDDALASNGGSVLAFLGAAALSGTVAASAADLVLAGDTSSANAGAAVAVGDADGDGADDVVVASPNARTSASGGGALSVWVALPSADAATSEADHVVSGASTGGAAGTALSIAADIDGDDLPDVVFSLPYADAGGVTGAGAVYHWAPSDDFPDEDGDGFVDAGAGGIDCDDTDPAVSPAEAEVAGNLADDDCDGWIDDALILRRDADGWEYDIDDVVGATDFDTFDFEDATAGADVAELYVADDLALSASGGVVSATSVWGAAPVDALGARVTPGSATNELTLVFGAEVDALAVRVLDGEGAFSVQATRDGTALIDGELLEIDVPDRTGGQYVGLTFAHPVDTLVLQGEYTDAWGLDDLALVWSAETDADGDGATEAEGDCDDEDAATGPHATEDLANGIDDDCDGVVDGGELYTFDDAAEWAAAAGLESEVVDFEDLAAGTVVGEEYEALGVTVDDSLVVVGDVGGAAPRGALAGEALAQSVTFTFAEDQPAVALHALDGAGSFTLRGSVGGIELYAASVDLSGDDVAGGVFIGLVFDVAIDTLTVETASSLDTWGVDDLTFSALGLDDADGDGLTEREGDCDDGDAEVSPEASETWYDGVDQDCDGESDYDSDGDGYDAMEWGGLDCEDEDGGVSPEEEETWYDGVDQDCDGGSDWDADSDGHDSEGAGGDDCDDEDGEVSPEADETWYDGVDDNCDPLDDDDADGDGWSGGSVSGEGEEVEDCDDTDASVGPDAEETWYDGVDADCGGESDYDADGDGYDAVGFGGTDCLDSRADVYPGAPGEGCYDGVDQDCDGSSDYDCDGDGHDGEHYGGEDCDDADAAVHPGATDTPRDGIDADCDGALEFDDDGDGWDGAEDGGLDCDDTDATVNPGAAESWYDGLDQDCDGAGDYDADGDGFDALDWGGTDCDDGDPTVWPGATDYYYDGVDNDCDGLSDYDGDGDGWEADWYGGLDCDDEDAGISPDAAETWYDGVDQDCDGGSDFDADGDGADASAHGGADCDDADASVGPAAVEIAGDGIDQDCDGLDQEDADGDGFGSALSGGADCDDADEAVHPGATDTCYDGVDQDCDGGSDWDCDGDGFDAADWGGSDCDDGDPEAYPGAAETWYDGVDQDCAGGDDYDQDGDGHAARVWGGDDCDEADPSVHGGVASDGCGGGDEDCDGETDEDCGADTGSAETGDSGGDTAETGGHDTAGRDTAPDAGDTGAGGTPVAGGTTVEGGSKDACGCASAPATGGFAGIVVLAALRRRREARG